MNTLWQPAKDFWKFLLIIGPGILILPLHVFLFLAAAPVYLLIAVDSTLAGEDAKADWKNLQDLPESSWRGFIDTCLILRAEIVLLWHSSLTGSRIEVYLIQRRKDKNDFSSGMDLSIIPHLNYDEEEVYRKVFSERSNFVYYHQFDLLPF